jgi:hypothetical protein
LNKEIKRIVTAQSSQKKIMEDAKTSKRKEAVSSSGLSPNKISINEDHY